MVHNDRRFGKIHTGLKVKDLARDVMPAPCVGITETTPLTVTTAQKTVSAPHDLFNPNDTFGQVLAKVGGMSPKSQ
ncbi:MAG TPA: hypothetical protein VJU59_44275 [Paraburkholderia sp.]|jgi:hypothetical protein|uniref:hypothetical protein n=1 Tax=Paraburkholderia sp. TaxID=1926495 RepID=UPI002B4A0EC5|nr:hypothetical protein [Paraburkholderia sp.]HKR46607.1 hypothetical protein [Paraburkholderia sp.]